MDDAFEGASFVLRSRNRLAILSEVADRPQTRADLVARTDGSRETVGRILRQFEDRDWVERDGNAYEATAFGRAVAGTIEQLLERLDALTALDPMLQGLPFEDLDLPDGALAGATVTVPEPTHPIRPTNRLTELGTRADEVSLYSIGMTPEATALHLELVRDEGQSFELVTTPDGVDAARATPQVRERLADLIATNAVVSVGDPDPSLPFFGRFDETTVIAVTADTGSIAGVVEWRDDRMLEWVDDRLDARFDAAEELTPEDIAD